MPYGGQRTKAPPWCVGRYGGTTAYLCLVLSINLAHCGNEFRSSVPLESDADAPTQAPELVISGVGKGEVMAQDSSAEGFAVHVVRAQEGASGG